MKLQKWKEVIICWVNALSASKINDISDLKNGEFFFSLLDQLGYSASEEISGLIPYEDKKLEFIISFIKDVYPLYDVPEGLSDETEVILLSSVFLVWSCLKVGTDSVLTPLFSLCHSVQCFIQAFLESLMSIPSASISREHIFSSILTINESSFTSDSYISTTTEINSSPRSIKKEFPQSPIEKLKPNLKELRSLHTEINVLSCENSFLQGELDFNKNEVKKLKSQVENKDKQILRLENEIFLISGEKSNKEKRRSGGGAARERKLKSEIEDLEKFISSLRTELDEALENCNRLRKKVTEIENESFSWRRKFEESEERCYLLESQVSYNESLINQLQQTCQELRELLEESKNDTKDFCNDSSFIQNEEEPSSEESLATVVDVQFRELQLNFQAQAGDLLKLKQALQEKDKKIYNLMAVISNNNVNMKGLEEELASVKGSLSSKEEEIQDLLNSIGSLSRELEKVDESCRRLVEDNSLHLGRITELECLNMDLYTERESLSALLSQATFSLLLHAKEIHNFESHIRNKHIHDNKVNIDKLENESNVLLFSVDSFISNFHNFKDNINDILFYKDTLLVENENLRNSVDSFKKEIDVNIEKIKLLDELLNQTKELLRKNEEDFDKLEEKNALLELSVKMFESGMKKLIDDLCETKSVLSNGHCLTDCMIDVHSEVRRLIEENEQFCYKVNNLEDVIKVLESEKQVTTKEVNILLNKCSSLELEFLSYKGNIQELSEINKLLKINVSSMALDLVKLNDVLLETKHTVSELNDEIIHLKNLIENSEKDIVNLNLENQELNKQVFQHGVSLLKSEEDRLCLENENEELTKNVLKAETNLKEANIILLEFKNEINKLNDLNVAVKKDNEDNNLKIESLVGENKELKKLVSQNCHFREEIDSVRQVNSCLESENTNLLNEINNLTKTTKHIQLVLTEKDDEISKLKMIISKLENLIKDRDREIENLCEKNEHIGDLLNEQIESHKIIRETLNSLKNELEIVISERDTLCLKEKALESSVSKLNSVVTTSAEAYEHLKDQLSEKEDVINKKDNEIRNLRNKLSDSEIFSYELKNNANELEEKFRNLKLKFEDTSNCNENLTSDLEFTKVSIEVLKKEKETFINEKEALCLRLAAVTKEYDTISKELADKKNEITINEGFLLRLSSITNSVSSWEALVDTIDGVVKDLSKLKLCKNSIQLQQDSSSKCFADCKSELQLKIRNLSSVISEIDCLKKDLNEEKEKHKKVREDLKNKVEEIECLTADRDRVKNFLEKKLRELIQLTTVNKNLLEAEKNYYDMLKKVNNSNDEKDKTIERVMTQIKEMERDKVVMINDYDEVTIKLTYIEKDYEKVMELNEGLKKQLAYLQNKLNVKVSEIESLTVDRDNSNLLLENKKSEIDKLKNLNKELVESENTVRDLLNEVSNKLAYTEEELSVTRDSNTSIKLLLSNQTTKIQDLETEKVNILDNNKYHETCLENCLEKLTLESNRVLELSNKISDLKTEIDNKTIKIKTLLEEKRLIECDNRSSSEEYLSLSVEVKCLKENLVIANETNCSLNTDLTNLKSFISNLETEKAQFLSEIKRLNDSLSEFDIQFQNKVRECQEMALRINNIQVDIENKTSEIMKVKKENYELNSALTESVKANYDLNQQLDTTKNENDNYIKDMCIKNKKIEDVNYLLSVKECENADASAEIKVLHGLVLDANTAIIRKNKIISGCDETVTNERSKFEEISNELILKNSTIEELNASLDVLKVQLIENSRILNQILTNLYSEAVIIQGGSLLIDVNENNSFGVLDDEKYSNQKIISMDVIYKNNQLGIIRALKEQIESVCCAVKEKDILCNDLNHKVNDLLAESRQLHKQIDSYKLQVFDLQKSIDEFKLNHELIMKEKEETIERLKEEVSLLEGSESLTTIELRVKIDELAKLSLELGIKLKESSAEKESLKSQLSESEGRLEATVKLFQEQLEDKNKIVQKLEQDVNMLEHEKSILDKRVMFLSQDVEEMNSVKAELAFWKPKIGVDCDEGLTTGRKDGITDEEKLTQIKPSLREELRACFESAMEQIIVETDEKIKNFKDKLRKAEIHIEELSCQLWEASDKQLLAQQEVDRLRAHLSRQAIPFHSSPDHDEVLPIDGALHRLSYRSGGFDNLGCEELEKMDDVFPINYHQKRVRSKRSFQRKAVGGLPKFALLSGKVFPVADEEEEIFNENFLCDLKAGVCDIPDINPRHFSCPPINQEEGNRRESCTKSIQSLDRHKKEVGQITYRRPGPPTPSKNGGRMSLPEANVLPTGTLKEVNNMSVCEEKQKSHGKIKNLFTAKSKVTQKTQNESDEGTSKKKMGFFKRKLKGRENESPPF